jgi:hypothetical protein
MAKVWDKEEMPKDWLYSVICPVYKKEAIMEELHC